ncbi:MAG: hypothetical protein Q8T11_04485 [Elusimicrobiota bacterium]|nr:hypothetical protein [Elusimicrobiota bacterium]
MKMQTKRWPAALALLAGLAVNASAADTDSLAVTITPEASYSLTLSTGPGAGDWLNLGVVPLSGSTWTVRPATVTVTSSYTNTDLTLIGTMLSGGWALEDVDASAPTADRLGAWAVFTDTSVAASPGQASGYFSGIAPDTTGSDVIDDIVQDVGTGADGKIMFVAAPGDAGYRSMEDNKSTMSGDTPAATSHLWLRFKLPPTTTNLDPKVLQLTVTAGAPN